MMSVGSWNSTTETHLLLDYEWWSELESATQQTAADSWLVHRNQSTFSKANALIWLANAACALAQKRYGTSTIKFPIFLPVSRLYPILINCMIIYMNLCKTKGVLGIWKLWFSYINESLKKFRLVFRQFWISSWRKKGHEPSQAKPKWKSFSSSSGSCQLGLDSSLSTSHFYKTSEMLKFLDTIRLDIIDIVLNTWECAQCH
jgi:hypothetical protein